MPGEIAAQLHKNLWRSALRVRAEITDEDGAQICPGFEHDDRAIEDGAKMRCQDGSYCRAGPYLKQDPRDAEASAGVEMKLLDSQIRSQSRLQAAGALALSSTPEATLELSIRAHKFCATYHATPSTPYAIDSSAAAASPSILFTR